MVRYARGMLSLVLLVATVGCSAPDYLAGDEASMMDYSGETADAEMAPADAPEAMDESAMRSAGLSAGAVVEAPPADAAVAQQQVVLGTPLPPDVGGPAGGTRRIVKNADMSLEVEKIDTALSRLETAAVSAGGYVLQTSLDQYDGSQPGATIGMAVPVDAFETTLQRIREAGLRVLSEHASGTDVSQEYVDIEAQIANLEATQARVRAFLDDATTVEEALRVNAELTRIEGEIGQLRGRLQYLGQRSAFSTITVQIIEKLSDATATPQPTRTPGPPWDPSDTIDDATATLGTLLRGLATLAIWVTIVILPVLIPVLLVVWLFSRWRERRRTPPGGGDGGTG